MHYFFHSNVNLTSEVSSEELCLDSFKLVYIHWNKNNRVFRQGFDGRDGIPGASGMPGPPGNVFIIDVSFIKTRHFLNSVNY